MERAHMIVSRQPQLTGSPMHPLHNATNTGKKPVKILAVYIVEKGKPIAEPARRAER